MFGKIKPDKVKGESGLGNQIWLAESKIIRGFYKLCGINPTQKILGHNTNIWYFTKINY